MITQNVNIFTIFGTKYSRMVCLSISFQTFKKLSSTNFTWSILEYFVPYIVLFQNIITILLIICQYKTNYVFLLFFLKRKPVSFPQSNGLHLFYFTCNTLFFYKHHLYNQRRLKLAKNQPNASGLQLY